MSSDSPESRPHLFAAASALLIAGLALAAALIYGDQLERRYIHALAPEFTESKLQGVVLQKRAVEQPDLLVLYGSSELVREVPNHASQFFQDFPSGFRVFPIGKAGTTSLAVLQKVAAVGADMQGRKVAFSISPGWFLSEVFDPQFYEGNFSRMQAAELAFSTDLSRELKRDIARRMLEFPKTLRDDWVLDCGLERLAGDTPLDRAIFAMLRPMGFLETSLARVQDHIEAALHIMDEDDRFSEPVPKRGLRALNWNRILRGAAFWANATTLRAKKQEVAKRRVSREKSILNGVAHAKEWSDIELLLRTFKELGAQPLLLSMPIEDIRLEAYGASPMARTNYINRLDALADRYDFTLLDFHEYQKDPGFLADFLDHLSEKGWLYYNKALDDFFHGRTSRL